VNLIFKIKYLHLHILAIVNIYFTNMSTPARRAITTKVNAAQIYTFALMFARD